MPSYRGGNQPGMPHFSNTERHRQSSAQVSHEILLTHYVFSRSPSLLSSRLVRLCTCACALCVLDFHVSCAIFQKAKAHQRARVLRQNQHLRLASQCKVCTRCIRASVPREAVLCDSSRVELLGAGSGSQAPVPQRWLLTDYTYLRGAGECQ